MAARSRGLVALVIFFGLAAFGGIRQWTERRLAATREAEAAAAAAAPVNVYTLVTRLYHRDPATFTSRLPKLLADTVRLSPEYGGLVIDEQATVADVGPTLRVEIGYRGPVEIEGRRPRRVEGEIREYFHARGVDVIRATCIMQSGPCARHASLLAQAEAALLEHLGDAGPVGVLPDGGHCEASRENVVGAGVHTMTCLYDGQLELALRRMTDKDAQRLASVLINDPAFRDGLEGHP